MYIGYHIRLHRRLSTYFGQLCFDSCEWPMCQRHINITRLSVITSTQFMKKKRKKNHNDIYTTDINAVLKISMIINYKYIQYNTIRIESNISLIWTLYNCPIHDARVLYSVNSYFLPPVRQLWMYACDPCSIDRHFIFSVLTYTLKFTSKLKKFENSYTCFCILSWELKLTFQSTKLVYVHVTSAFMTFASNYVPFYM